MYKKLAALIERIIIYRNKINQHQNKKLNYHHISLIRILIKIQAFTQLDLK